MQSLTSWLVWHVSPHQSQVEQMSLTVPTPVSTAFAISQTNAGRALSKGVGAESPNTREMEG